MTSTPLAARDAATGAPDAPTEASPRVTLRPYGGAADHPGMAAAFNADRVAQGMAERATVAGFDAMYRHLTNCDPERDIAILAADGEIAGYARTYWEDRNTGERCFEFVELHDPHLVGREELRTLLGWLERRSGENLAAMTEIGDRPVIESSYAIGRGGDWEAVLLAGGFTLGRLHAQMERPDLAAIPDIPLPEGLEIRAIDPADQALIRRVFDADCEVFRDHWGGVDCSETAFRRFQAEPEFDPRMWRVAFDGEEIAGQILNWVDPPAADGSRRGWTESIAVRRPWRRRGLARALLAASLRAVRDAGATVASLGVDQSNPNHALGLYESLGFRVTAEELEYHKVLRPGARA